MPKCLDVKPIDPFTGNLIEYERLDDEGFILFTPGELGVSVPTKGDASRIEFIRNLEDYNKFEYRVPPEHSAREANTEDDEE